MSEYIHRDKWDEWDQVRIAALARLADIGHDIMLVLDEDSPQHDETAERKQEKLFDLVKEEAT